MLITRETDYAIRIVRNLHEDVLSQIEEVAHKEEISLTMAHKICRKLKKADVIDSKAGVHGGYHLTRKLEELTLFDVFAAMNKVTAINQCLHDKESCTFAKNGTCKVHLELARIQECIIEELKRKPLSELI